QEQADEHRDDGDHHQQLNQREALGLSPTGTHGKTPQQRWAAGIRFPENLAPTPGPINASWSFSFSTSASASDPSMTSRSMNGGRRLTSKTRRAAGRVAPTSLRTARRAAPARWARLPKHTA